MTKARQLIAGASYHPDTLKIITQAFDEAWSSIAGNFAEDAQSIEAARLKLANAILSIANDGSRDVQRLKNAALQTVGVALIQSD